MCKWKHWVLQNGKQIKMQNTWYVQWSSFIWTHSYTILQLSPQHHTRQSIRPKPTNEANIRSHLHVIMLRFVWEDVSICLRCDLSLCVNTCLVFDSFIDDGNIIHSWGPVWIILLLAKAVRWLCTWWLWLAVWATSRRLLRRDENFNVGFWNFTTGFETSTSVFETSTSGFETSTSVFETSTSAFETSTSAFETSTSVFETSRRVLKLQRRVLKLQRRFLKLQRRVLKLQRRFLKLQHRVFKLQRRLLKLQRTISNS